MTGAFTLLGLPADADERAVKRAYARLLKTTRPDEDPVGFQRLNQAYQRALEELRNRPGPENPAPGPVSMAALRSMRGELNSVQTLKISMPAGDAEYGPPVDTKADPAPQHGTLGFDVAFFTEQLRLSLADPDPRRIRASLYDQDALYSIELKRALRPAVIEVIRDAPRIGNPHVAALLLDFFGLDRMDQDGLFLQAQAALERKQREERLDSAVRNLRQPGSDFVQRQIGHELAGDTSWQRRWFLLLAPNASTRIGYVLINLRRILPSLQHTALDPATIAFWDQVLDKRKLHPMRVYSALGRLLPLTFAFFLVLAIMATPQDRSRLVLIGAAVTVGMAPLWFLYAFWKMHRGQVGILFEQRWGLPSGSFFLLLWLVMGLAVAWWETVSPGSFGLGTLFLAFWLLFVCARLQQGQPSWFAGLSMISLVTTPAALGGASMIAFPDPSPLRLKVILTMTALSLALTIWMMRPGRWQRIARWIVPAFAIAALTAAVLIKTAAG